METDAKPVEVKITKISSTIDQNIMRNEYEKHLEVRQLVVNDVEKEVEQILKGHHSSPTVNGRIKSFSSYYGKYLALLRGGDKSPKITDLLGIRVICPFIEDLVAVEEMLNDNLNVIDIERKGHYNFKEFGYESIHLLITIPQEIIAKRGNPVTDVVEIQIRTILQDAWAEVEHELVYKAEFTPFDEPMKRKLAAVNASLTLADIIFQEIRVHQRNYSGEMDKRRKSFFRKIEEATDNLLFTEVQSEKTETPNITADINMSVDNASIDDLLVEALTAHNQNRFTEAIRQYSKILELNPGADVCSIINKHRGMAYFACSRYNEAIEDFTRALELDAKSYKAAYYRGVVHSVTKQYSRAIDDYTLSLSINPYQSFCLFRRGQAYYHIGDESQALADCETSLALEPQNISASKFRDMLHEKLKM